MIQHQQYHQNPHGQAQGPQSAGGSIAPGPGANGQPWGGPFPSLHLWPLQDTFAMKMIHLPDGQRIKIGRQTNNKTVPGERNAYFDSKVLSRLHAEIWEQNGKMYIKDVRSSNGTFINGERLSPESVESEPFELKSEDQVEFGIDIVSEDNRTIVHHKVAAKVYCVFNPDDAAFSARELVNYQNQDARGVRRMTGPSNGHQNNQLAQMGAPIMSSGGKTSGLSFDHVLNKLQSELARSKETGAELQNLATAFTDIQETLGGGLPPSQNGSAAQFIPPQFRSTSTEAQAALAGPHGQQAAAFIALQNQLTETQTSLAGQLDKIRELEGQLKEHETIGREVSAIREQMEDSKREMDLLLAGHRGRRLGRRMDDDDDDDDDDSRSVMTLMDSDDAEQRVRDRRRAERERDEPNRERERRQPDRPRTPEPHLNGDIDDDAPTHHKLDGGAAASANEIIAQNAELVTRIQTLSAEISEAMQLSRSLQAEHSEAMSAVKLLTDRVGALESGITSRVAEEVTKTEERWESWRVKFEDGWRKERESWDAERERLRGVVREWEEASRRAHEEEEERELNKRLSADGESDSDEESEIVSDDDEVGEEGGPNQPLSIDGWEEGAPPSPNKIGLPTSSSGSISRKQKRRRQSSKGLLAVRGMAALAGDVGESLQGGSSTPKQSMTSVIENPANLATSSSKPNRDRERPNGSTFRRRKGGKRGGGGGTDLSRSGSSRTIKGGSEVRKSSPLATASLSRTEGAREKDENENERTSSESGKESGDTLKDNESEGASTTGTTRGGSGAKKGKKVTTEKTGGPIQPLPIFTVLVVAVVAGALYYKHKE